MSTTQVTSLEDRLAKIAEKSGSPLAEIKTAYADALASVPAKVKVDKRRIDMAVLIVNKDFLVNTKSTAVFYEGVIIGAERTRDLMEYKRDAAFKAYEENPQDAIDNGLVKVEGEDIIPLDTRDEVQGVVNKKKGQPLKKNMFMRKLYIAARKPGDAEYVTGTMTLWNELAKIVVPTMKQVSFMANGDLTDTNCDLRSSVDTVFDIGKELSDEDVISIIDDKYQTHFKNLKECWEFHQEIRDDKKILYDSLVVTEGSVVWIQEFDKSIKIVLTDDSLNEIPFHERGVTCWLPMELKHLINFGKGSIVTVIARTGQGKYYDSEKKVQTDDDVLQMNLFSLIGRPGLTVEQIQEGESV